MNYYQHHIGDYDSHTAHLTWLEDAAYRRLICLYYRTQKPISLDVGAVCRLIRANSRYEKEAVAQVLKEFFVLGDDGYHSARCDNEINAYAEKVDKNRANGAKGGRPKKEPTGNPQETQTVIDGLNLETQKKGNQEPRTKNQEPRTSNHIKSMAIPPIEQAQESPPKTKRFVKPSIQETQEYFRDLKSNQAQAFFDFYESKGWLVGKAKMKDWKAAARGWVSRQSNFENSRQGSQNKTAIAKNQDAWDEYYAQQAQEERIIDVTPHFRAIDHVQ